MQAAELVDGRLVVTIDGKRHKQTADETDSEFTSRLSTGRHIVAAPADIDL